MAKAQVTMPDGITVKIDGTSDEIYDVVRRLQAASTGPASRRSGSKQRPKTQRPKLVDLIASLIDGGFFSKRPKDLASVKTALEELGHHYPVTTLSGAMLDQVRRRNLRRLKENDRWVYTR